jgi:preprotein translocase subunit SecD
MKSIIYLLIAVFIFGILAMGITNKPSSTQTIILSPTGCNTTPARLLQSAEIISRRLKSFGAGRVDVKTIPANNQIQVILTNKRDLKITEDLITQKGLLEFYETYDYESFTKLLIDDSSLIKLFPGKAHGNSSAIIGCTSLAEMNSVNQYLDSSGLNEKYKFAWSGLFGDSDVCLYALKTGNEDRIMLSGADIQSFEAKHDTKMRNETLTFRFKKPAIQVWADVTKRNQNKAIAILMDNRVIFAPVVTSEITGGDCEISGNFTKTQVRYIAAIGANGELPLSFRIVK